MPLSLAAHLTSHSDDRHYVPDFPNCTADYKDPDALRAHKLSHTDDPTPYKCDVDGCDKAYSSSGMLGQHKKTHIVWACDLPGCPRTFKNEIGLRDHKHTHTADPKPHKCDCKAAYPSPKTLHTQKKHQTCPQCHKTIPGITKK
jgi:uncharacterized Zn-finger protein